MKSKQIFQRIMLGIKKGHSTPNLPENVINFLKKKQQIFLSYNQND